MIRRGAFITFEGIEGSGKSTQLGRLAARLSAAGGDPLCTREPGGTELGRALRALLLAPSSAGLDPWCELLLYVADRAQHLAERVEPALAAGRVVLGDRFVDATLAYQGHGRGLDLDAIRALHARPPLDRRPERTILLDLPAERGLARARRRDRESGRRAEAGRFEAESLAFHRRVRQGYLALAAAEPARFRVVEADAEEERVAVRVALALSDLPALEGLAP